MKFKENSTKLKISTKDKNSEIIKEVF